MALAPSTVAAIGLAVLGLGLTVAAFLPSLSVLRLVLGLGLIGAAIATAGLGALLSHGGSVKGDA